MTGEAFGPPRGPYDAKIAMGYPVNTTSLPEGQQRLYAQAAAEGYPMKYYPGSIVMPCGSCQIDIFIGPRTAETLRQDPEIKPLCPICCVVVMTEHPDAEITNYTLGNDTGYSRDT